MENLQILKQLLNGHHLEPKELQEAGKLINRLQVEVRNRQSTNFESHDNKVTIDNNLRMYQVRTSTGKQAFCNIEDLNTVVRRLETNPGYFKVYHFWNNKPQYLSRKVLDQMFEGSELKRQFDY